ncbi:MAG: hypothetical protein HYV07_29570 [Deltaproteobacteria bacterium]|nr:hypothetical protein [Deltaproteobacteria bacterium]
MRRGLSVLVLCASACSDGLARPVPAVVTSAFEQSVGPPTEDTLRVRVDPGSPRLAQNRFGALASAAWRFSGRAAPRDLDPVRNNVPYPEPQPRRLRPDRVTLDGSGTKLYVTLPGTEGWPNDELAVIDVASRAVKKRIRVGRRPYGAFLHPAGRFLLVTAELSSYVSVVDTRSDAVVSEIPLDFYAQGVTFSPDGAIAYVAIRYLDQVLVVDLKPSVDSLHGQVRELGGFDFRAFAGAGSEVPPEVISAARERGFDDREIAGASKVVGGVHAILRARCARCHRHEAGGLLVNDDPVESFLSAVESSKPGDPYRSLLLTAVLPGGFGGFGDDRDAPGFHPGGALFDGPSDPAFTAVAAWIEAARVGPGIPVGNFGSHPKDLVLDPGGRWLYVGDTGTLDVGVIDTETLEQVGAIYIGNVANHVAVVRDRAGRDQLVVLTLGAGFGAAKERDPLGAESWDRSNPSAQFAILRDPVTTDPYPLDRQPVLGPHDAVDGTWNLKMKDVQNDLVAIDLSAVRWAPPQHRDELEYQVLAARYEAHPEWVRYTSDTAEATASDVKGDLPPELMRVPGSFPEWVGVDGDLMFVSMSGSFEVVEWQVDPLARDPSDRLVPLRTFEAGLRPVGLAVGRRGTVSANLLFTADQLGESVSVIDRATGAREEIGVGELERPPFDTEAERGELVAHSTVFSSDGDSSCLHCHYRDTGDGRGWGAAESIGQDRDGRIVAGGTLGIPQMRNVFPIQPYYFEGTHRLGEGQGADINEPASSIDFVAPIWAGDFSKLESPVPSSQRRELHEELKERQSVRKLGSIGYDLHERRDAFIRAQSMQYFGEAAGLFDLYRFVGEFLGSSPKLLPNPFDPESPSVIRGARVFSDVRVMCSICHAPPEFTNKTRELADNPRRALPPLTTITRRDASYTLASVHAVEAANGRKPDMDPLDEGRVEETEGSFTTMQLRGLFERPSAFLHHGRARSLREVVATPGHRGLGRYRLPVMMGLEDVRPGRLEVGFNELTRTLANGAPDPADRVVDTHGGTSQLTPRQLDALVDFLRSLE